MCTTCHNLEREDPDLRVSDPEARLPYVKKKGIPFLQGTTFRGIVNRESWYNDDYVRKYASCYSTTIPKVELGAEVCDNGSDDNLDGVTDCDDPACADARACQAGILHFQGEGGDIADNDPEGLSSTIEIDAAGTVKTAYVDVQITHSYSGDLVVELITPDGQAHTLQSKKGGSTDDINRSFTLAAEVDGVPAAGAWTLRVTDTAKGDVGRLERWSLDLTLGGTLPPETCDDGIDNDTNGRTDCADDACKEDPACQSTRTIKVEGEGNLTIPDNKPKGVDSIIEVTEDGTIESVSVHVDITHAYRADLVITLENESGTKVTLFEREGEGADNLVRTFTPTEFAGGQAKGLWLLNVSDHGNLDEGTLNAWTLELVVR